MRTLALVFAVCLAIGFGLGLVTAQGPPKTYTVQFTHDGANADRYDVLVDGTVAATIANDTSACQGTGATRLCAGPLTMTTGVTHVVTVRAVGLFGEAMSDPFSAAPPLRPAGVVIK